MLKAYILQALLSVYRNALNVAEANSILTYMSFLETVSLEFVTGFEDLLEHPDEDTMLEDQLLLVFGSLAVKGSEEVEIRVMDNLKARTLAFNARASRDLSETEILLHALGNTGSNMSLPLIMSILNSTSMEHYSKVKLIAIEAFVKLTDNPAVLAQLESFLEDDSSADCVATILETLHNGFQYIEQQHQDTEHYISMTSTHTLIYSLADTVGSTNNTDLHVMMVKYLQLIKADEIILLTYGLVGNRGKRGTFEWDHSSISDYNYVDSLVNRQNHVNTYTRHTAYINSKKIGMMMHTSKLPMVILRVQTHTVIE